MLAPWQIHATVNSVISLRSRREKLCRRRAVGLPAGQRRRTAGLRREEVAQLAGIGVDWSIRLEQGRTVAPSVTTVDALARALRLSKTEHARISRTYARDGDAPCVHPRGGDAAHSAFCREPAASGLHHRAALGRAGLERSRRGGLLNEPAAGRGSQHATLDDDQQEARRVSPVPAGRMWPSAWSRCFAPPMMSGPVIPPLRNC